MTHRETHLEGFGLDKYKIEAFVAAGGFAEVYRARDTMLDIDVMVKVLKPSQADPTSIARFREEAMRTANLHQPDHHPNIVEVFAVGESNGYHWLAMRQLHGETLEARLQRGALPLPEVVRVLHGVASALDHAHSRSLIHRDIKPSNIFLTGGNGVQLMDFGLVRELKNAAGTATMTIIGTPQYMSPEQIKGEGISARSDVYSLGLVAYEMITGRAAFPHEPGDTWKLLLQQVNEDPQRMRLPDGRWVPAGIEAAVQRAVRKQPSERWGSAGALAAAVAAGVGERHVVPSAGSGSVRPVMDTVPGPRLRSTGPVRPGVGGMALLGVGAVALVVLVVLAIQPTPSGSPVEVTSDISIAAATRPAPSVEPRVQAADPPATVIARTARPTFAEPSTGTPPPSKGVESTAIPVPVGNEVAVRSGFGYGMQVHATDDAERAVQAVADLGFGWLKQSVSWASREPEPGRLELEEIDVIVNLANARGIDVLMTVYGAPAWARPPGADLTVAGPPIDSATYAAFIAALAERYRGRVRAYEVWQHQNLREFWGGEPLDAGRYVQLLCATYRAIKAVDPGAIVVSGAPSPTGLSNGLRAIDDVDYLNQMYASGLRGCSNAVGAHPAGYNKPPTAEVGWSAPDEPDFSGHRSFYFQGTMVAYRELMTRYGDGGEKLWVTDFGWASVENTGLGPAPGFDYAAQNTEAEQAQYLVDAFNLGRRWGFVGPMFVNNLNRATLGGAESPFAAFGILYADWSLRPAYVALQAMRK